MRALTALLVVGLLAVPVQADLTPGVPLFNPAIGGSLFTAGGVPANFSFMAATSTNSFQDGVYTGTVTSTVWRDPGTGFLAFAYSFELTGVGTANSPIETATIGGAEWANFAVTAAGADGLGSSDDLGNPGTNWFDGNPLSMGISFTDGTPGLVFFSGLDGTVFDPAFGDSSATFWFATNSTTFGTDLLTVQDGGAVDQAVVFVVPAPAAVLLGMMGLGMVGWMKRRFRSDVN